jgi:hypothetical protein
MEKKTRKVRVEPIIMIEYDTKKKRFVGSLEVGKECKAYEAIKNVMVEDKTRLKVFAQLEEGIAALRDVLVLEKVVKTRKPKTIAN